MSAVDQDPKETPAEPLDTDVGLPDSPAEPVEAEAAGTAAAPDPQAWDKLVASLDPTGVFKADGGPAIPIDEMIEKFATPGLIERQPPQVRVALRLAKAAVDHERATAAAAFTEKESALKAREQALELSELKLAQTRKAFVDMAMDPKALAGLQAAAAGADKADTTTEAGRRAFLASQTLGAMTEMFAPLRQHGEVAAFDATMREMQAKYPEMKQKDIADDVEALINKWDEQWLGEGGEKTGRPSPSAGRLEDAIVHVLHRRSREAGERQRVAHTAARARAASKVQATAGGGGGRGTLPTHLPDTYNGRPLKGMEALSQYREENPDAWRSIMAAQGR